MPVSSSTEHWIKPDALTINLNHFGDPDYLQVSVLAGAVVMAFKQDVIGYNAAHNYRTWPLEAANTYLETTSAYNVYARLTRSEVNARALVVYDTVLRDIEGREITYAEDGSEVLGDANPDYFYMYLGQISASVNSNGESVQREWNSAFNAGRLQTNQQQNDLYGGFERMFRPHYDDPLNPDKITWIEALTHLGVAGGITMFVDGGKVNLPSIYEGLPIDNSSIYWEETTNEDGSVTRILKAKVGSGEGGSDTMLGDLKNVGEWANAIATEDRIMVQKKDSTTWTSLFLSEIGGTADFSNVKESGEGNAYTSIVLSEDKKTLTLNKGESFAKQTDYEALNTKVTDFLEGSDTDGIINKWRELESFLSNMEQSDDLAEILSGKADKGTTLEDYGITDSYTKSEVDSALKDYVTIDGKETITGEKNFTGGLNVNGSPIVYDKDKKYWKLTGDLLVTGGVTMFANEGTYSPSTIMDAITTDNVNLKVVNGVLTFVGETGGGVADSVDWENIDGKPSWIGSVKPSYTFSEIGSKPTTLSGYGITDAKISNGVITLGGNTITPLTQEKGDARYLRLTGGTLSNGSEKSPLILDCSTRTPIITFRNNGANAGFVGGQASGSGMMIQAGSSADGTYSVFKVNMDGSMEISTNDVYYDVLTSKNYGSYLGYIGSTKVQKSSAAQDLTGIGSINSAVTINSGEDSAWIKGSGHKMYFGGTGYANQSYYFRPLYGASGATTSNLYIQNASADSSPTFTTTHSFLSNGNASHSGSLTISGIELSKSKDDVLFIDANLVVRGGITMYGTDGTTSSSIWDGAPIASTSVKGIASFDSEFFAVNNGKVTFIGETGGGVADSVDWKNVTDKPTWIGSTKPSYTYSEITDKPDLSTYALKTDLNGYAKKSTTLSGYGITDATISNGVITLGSNTITPLTQTTGDARYITAIGTSGNYLTYTKNGTTQNVTVPYAVNADQLDGTHSTGFYKSNAGSLESDELEAFVNRDSGGYSVTYRSASTGAVSYSGMFSVLKSGAGSVQAIELIANNYTLKQGALQVRLNVNGTRYSATKTIAFSDGNVATADTASKLSTVSKTAWGQTYWTSGGVPTDISGNMTGVGNITMSGSINSAVTINSGDDSSWIKGSGHNMYFGGTGYANQSYYFRPLYGASGATTSNLYIQNASASSSPTFTTTHSFLSNGNASHAGTLTINGIKLSKSKDDVLFIDANLVVRGAVTMYGTNSVTASTIMDGILVDDSTIIKDPTTKKLMINPDLELGGGLDETALASYLTTNKYLTQTTGDIRYVTALGINGNILTWTKNGVVNNITVPYATTAKELTSYSAITFSKSDNSGKPCYLLIADVTSWYNVSSGATNYGIAGFVYGYRNGAVPAYSMNIAARCSYGKGYYSLDSSLKSIIEPRVVSYSSKYYLALYLKGANRTFYFIGGKDNLLSSFTELQCSDGNGTYSGLSVVYKGSATGTSSKADSLSTSRTISISGHAAGSGSFDGSEDLDISIDIPTRNVYINGTGYTVHSTITTDTTGVYAPTSGGTSGYVLKANGDTSIPTWVAQSSLSVGTAAKLSTVSKTAWGQTYWTSGGVPTSISGSMTGVGSITMSGALSGATTGTFSSTLSGNEVVISNSGGTTSGHLRFSRASANYIAIPTGGTLAVNLDGSINAAGSDLIVRDGAVHPGTSGSTSLGRDGNLWNGLYLYGGSTSSAFNKFGINFGADVARISANSSGGLGVYAIGDLSKIYLRAGCTTTGASSTGLVVDADGNVEITGNLLVQGGITMYATSDENPNPEFYAKDIYITGYSDGRYSKLTQSGGYVFHIPASGTWASGWSAYDDTAGQSLGNAFGMYGNGSTLTYFYYGGTYSSPWIKLQKTSMEGTYWKLNDTSTNPYLKLVQGSDWYIQGYQSYLYLGAGRTKSLRISSDGSLYTPKTLTQGSDIRYKDIHKDILLSLATMAEAPSIEFHFKDDEQKSTHIGTSAQYWQSVSGVVTEDSEGRLGMDYSSLGVVMGISLAKELSRFENDTDRRIRLLEEENKRLKEEIEQLKTA